MDGRTDSRRQEIGMNEEGAGTSPLLPNDPASRRSRTLQGVRLSQMGFETLLWYAVIKPPQIGRGERVNGAWVLG
jgi:hypothetical protein